MIQIWDTKKKIRMPKSPNTISTSEIPVTIEIDMMVINIKNIEWYNGFKIWDSKFNRILKTKP